ncbi:MAG: hypothetical protein KatS3mg002_1602 [Candidatus Woesearchaeota archaeon]|nr:MAG: hypothetical protein KatS3mg002_1602 [Candidatus Woesearchaeota archaeon]
MGKIVRIKPNVNPNSEMLGLEKYNEVMFPGVNHEYSIASYEIPGTNIVKFMTGLDEEANYLKALPPSERDSEIKRIREEVAALIKMIDNEVVDINDPLFWKKCERLKPTNETFWKNIKLRIDNKGRFLNLDIIEDRIIYNAIKGGGFPEIARDYKLAITNYNKFKFYLDEGDAITHVVEDKKTKAQAYKELINLIEDESDLSLYRLKYITRLTVGSLSSIGVKEDKFKDLYFNKLEQYLESDRFSKSSRYFVFLTSKSLQHLALASLLKDMLDTGDAIRLEDNNKIYIKELNLVLMSELHESTDALLEPSFREKLNILVNNYARSRGVVPEHILTKYDKIENTNETFSIELESQEDEKAKGKFVARGKKS